MFNSLKKLAGVSSLAIALAFAPFAGATASDTPTPFYNVDEFFNVANVGDGGKSCKDYVIHRLETGEIRESIQLWRSRERCPLAGDEQWKTRVMEITKTLTSIDNHHLFLANLMAKMEQYRNATGRLSVLQCELKNGDVVCKDRVYTAM